MTTSATCYLNTAAQSVVWYCHRNRKRHTEWSEKGKKIVGEDEKELREGRDCHEEKDTETKREGVEKRKRKGGKDEELSGVRGEEEGG